MKTIKRIKSGVVERTLAVAKLSLSAGRNTAHYSLKKVLGAESDWSKHLMEQAQLLTGELGELKGSLMKAGQMLSIYGERFLPPEVAKVFRGLHKESQPVEWRVMRDLIRERLGSDRFGKLRIDPEPVGAASLGQVYRAIDLVTGECLAIKVQYPGIDQAIDNDIRLLKMLLKSARILPTGGGTNQWDEVFEEIRDLLKQEADSLKEAHCAREYRRTFGQREELAIPAVVERYTTPGILAMSFEDGAEFADVRKLNQEDRDLLGSWILKLFFEELFAYRLVQTDAHFGNYRFRTSDEGRLAQLVLLDFGAVKALPEEFAHAYRDVVRGLYYGDKLLALDACEKLGLLSSSDSDEQKSLFYDFCLLLAQPFRMGDVFDFGSTDLSERARIQGTEVLKALKFRVPSRDQVWIDRKIAGLYTMLTYLEAKVDCRTLLAPYLETTEQKKSEAV